MRSFAIAAPEARILHDHFYRITSIACNIYLFYNAILFR